MKKNIIISVSIVGLALASFTLGSNMHPRVAASHTFQNVAIYNTGSIIDEDGEKFDIDFNCANDSVLLVTYDNHNTVTRLDDTPIDFEVLEAN